MKAVKKSLRSNTPKGKAMKERLAESAFVLFSENPIANGRSVYGWHSSAIGIYSDRFVLRTCGNIVWTRPMGHYGVTVLAVRIREYAIF